MVAMPRRSSARATPSASSSVPPATKRKGTRRPSDPSVASRLNHGRSVSHSTGARRSGPFTTTSSGRTRSEYRRARKRPVSTEKGPERRGSPRPRSRPPYASRAQVLRATYAAVSVSEAVAPFRWALGPSEPPHKHSQLALPTVLAGAPSRPYGFPRGPRVGSLTQPLQLLGATRIYRRRAFG